MYEVQPLSSVTEYSLPVVLATIPNGTITECSLSRLTFEFLELRLKDLHIAAACLDSKNRTCVRENQ